MFGASKCCSYDCDCEPIKPVTTKLSDKVTEELTKTLNDLGKRLRYDFNFSISSTACDEAGVYLGQVNVMFKKKKRAKIKVRKRKR